MNLIDVLQLLLLCVLLGAVALLFHKVRKIHLVTYELLSAAAETKTLFAQIQALHALERQLALPRPLPPVRGWAGSPDFLLKVAGEVAERRPQVVMECSSGVSTLVVARSLQMNGSGHVYSLEHDEKYANETRLLLQRYGLSDWATVIHAPLERREAGDTPWYAESAIPADLPPVELLVVDGPPASGGPLARYPALPRLIGRLARTAVVIADDTARADETEMIRRWQQSFPGIQVTDGYCEKGCTILRLGAA
jgi:hypothetical protein